MHLTAPSLGVALALAGLPLAWVARSLVGASDSRVYSAGLMLLALLLVVHWHNLLSLRFCGSALSALAPLLFLIPVLILSTYDDPPGQATQYILYSLLLFLACQTISPSRLSSLPYALLGVATAVSFLTLAMYAFVLGGFASEVTGSGRLTAGDTDNPNFVAFAGGLGIVASMLLPKHENTSKQVLQTFVVSLCFAICLLAILLSVTRSVYGGIAMCALAALVTRSRHGATSATSIHTLRAWSLLFVPTLLAVFGAGYLLLGEALLQYPLITIERTLLGLQGILFGTGGEDISSDTRFDLRQDALSGLTIGGRGFDALYVDFPILQAYYDLGILGGTAFLLLALIIPALWTIKVIFTRRSTAEAVTLAYIYIFFLPNILLHGKPYDFAIWLPVLLAYVGMGRMSQARRETFAPVVPAPV